MTEVPTESEFETVVLPKIETSVRNREPLSLTPEDIRMMRGKFEETGINFKLEKKERDSIIQGTQLRARVKLEDNDVSGVEVYDRRFPKGERWINYDPKTTFPEHTFKGSSGKFKDRGFGVIAMLGNERFGELVEWSYGETVRHQYPGKIGSKEGTEGRGLQQAAAELLTVASLSPEDTNFESELEEIATRLNRRIWKGLRKTKQEGEIEDIDIKFTQAGIEEPSKTLASFPPEALPELIRFLSRQID